MPTETRPTRAREGEHRRYSPFGAFLFALILQLASLPEAADDAERHDGQA